MIGKKEVEFIDLKLLRKELVKLAKIFSTNQSTKLGEYDIEYMYGGLHVWKTESDGGYRCLGNTLSDEGAVAVICKDLSRKVDSGYVNIWEGDEIVDND